jgi:lysophospholipase L1-like esterase
MPRPFRVLAAGLALVLATLATAIPATAAPAPAVAPAAGGAAPAPALPDSMAAIGDSITQAVDVCCFYGNWPAHSWSTGAAVLDGIASHYERIRARNPAIRGQRWNNAVSGARMADAPGQARRTVGQGAEYVTILMGANDLCGWDGILTPTATFRAQFAETLDILRTGLPGSRVFVGSIPNLYQLWSILRTDPVAQVVWQAAGICPSMLNFFNSAADRQAVIDRERELNDVLRDVCATWSNCRFDGYLIYDYDFTRDLVSRLDYFHPGLAGQATLAGLTWEASWWG